MRVESRVSVYEINGEPTDSGMAGPMVHVESHWNRDEFVVIDVEGKRVTVLASDLIRAIQNAQNWK